MLKIVSFAVCFILIVLIVKFLDLCKQVRSINMYLASIQYLLDKHLRKTDTADAAPNPPIPSAVKKPDQDKK